MIPSAFCISCALLVSAENVQSSDAHEKVGRAIAQWESFYDNATDRDGESARDEELGGVIDIVRRSTVRNPAFALRLLGIANDPSQTPFSRGRALVVACELADARVAEQILARMEQLRVGQPPLPDGDSSRVERDRRARGALYFSFIRDGIGNLLDVMPDHERILAYVVAVMGSRQSKGIASACVPLLARCKVAPEVKQSAIVEIISLSHSSRSSGSSSIGLYNMLDATAFPELRKLVREEATPDRFNFGAASALAFCGDEEIVADLESLRPACRENKYWNCEPTIKQLVWQIQVQHPPSKLLDYISSTDFHGYRHYRRGSVLRAYELGLDPARIRDAILAHARNAKAAGVRGEVASLMKTGFDLKILRKADLPVVLVYPFNE